jgi:hypothetical protein
MVWNAARAARRHPHAGILGLCYRQSRRRQDQNLRHHHRFQSHSHSGRHRGRHPRAPPSMSTPTATRSKSPSITQSKPHRHRQHQPCQQQLYQLYDRAGWALGAGAEIHLGGSWTGKVEYLYLSTTATNPLNSTPLAINFDSRVTNQIVRVGLNYKFVRSGLRRSRGLKSAHAVQGADSRSMGLGRPLSRRHHRLQRRRSASSAICGQPSAHVRRCPPS